MVHSCYTCLWPRSSLLADSSNKSLRLCNTQVSHLEVARLVDLCNKVTVSSTGPVSDADSCQRSHLLLLSGRLPSEKYEQGWKCQMIAVVRVMQKLQQQNVCFCRMRMSLSLAFCCFFWLFFSKSCSWYVSACLIHTLSETL